MLIKLLQYSYSPNRPCPTPSHFWLLRQSEHIDRKPSKDTEAVQSLTAYHCKGAVSHILSRPLPHTLMTHIGWFFSQRFDHKLAHSLDSSKFEDVSMQTALIGLDIMNGKCNIFFYCCCNLDSVKTQLILRYRHQRLRSAPLHTQWSCTEWDCASVSSIQLTIPFCIHSLWVEKMNVKRHA